MLKSIFAICFSEARLHAFQKITNFINLSSHEYIGLFFLFPHFVSNSISSEKYQDNLFFIPFLNTFLFNTHMFINPIKLLKGINET